MTYLHKNTISSFSPRIISTYLRTFNALASSNASLNFFPLSFEPHMLSSSTPKATLNIESGDDFMNRSYIDHTSITHLIIRKNKALFCEVDSWTYLNVYYLVGFDSFRQYMSKVSCIFSEYHTAKIPQNPCGEVMARQLPLLPPLITINCENSIP
ncbi:hypothetical protein H5410_012020 [Solanum commersonii]|uniref:Uncharacterized protein n=1 Tax=Solanum commersonii TaxID=4109 RepID=A0A9J6ARH1_SOLCO|nr:hypothetical protein H5410_012020 [Solanum commersonii]